MNQSYFIRIVVDPAPAVKGVGAVASALDKLEKQALQLHGRLKSLFAINPSGAGAGLRNLSTAMDAAARRADKLTSSLKAAFGANPVGAGSGLRLVVTALDKAVGKAEQLESKLAKAMSIGTEAILAARAIDALSAALLRAENRAVLLAQHIKGALTISPTGANRGVGQMTASLSELDRQALTTTSHIKGVFSAGALSSGAGLRSMSSSLATLNKQATTIGGHLRTSLNVPVSGLLRSLNAVSSLLTRLQRQATALGTSFRTTFGNIPGVMARQVATMNTAMNTAMNRMQAQVNRGGGHGFTPRGPQGLVASGLAALQGGNIVSAMREIAAVAVTGIAVKKVVELGDAYLDLESKVRMAAGKNDNLAESMDKVFAAANRSRTEVDTFGKTVLSMSGATANMNLGFDVSVRMAETLSKMLRIGGATAQESASVMTQYGQALRKGKADGDEFRAVMENSVPVQRALAKTLGISTDELLKFSKQGKITRQVMVDALVKNADEVDRQFAKMSMRVEDALTVLHNAAVRFVGSLRLNETISPIILWVADNFETLAKWAMVAANVIAAQFARKAIGIAIAGLQMLGQFALRNPFTVIAYAIGVAISALRVFYKDAKATTDGLATIGDVVSVMLGDAVKAFSELGQVVGAAMEKIASFFGDIVDIGDVSFGDILVFFSIMVDSMIALGEFLKDTLTETFGDMALAIGETFIDIFNKARKFVDETVNGKSRGGLYGEHTPGLGNIGVSHSGDIGFDDWSKAIDSDQMKVANLEAFAKAAAKVADMSPQEFQQRQQRVALQGTTNMVMNRTGSQNTSEMVKFQDDIALTAYQSQAEIAAAGVRAQAEAAAIRMKYGEVTYDNPLKGSREKALATMDRNLGKLEGKFENNPYEEGTKEWTDWRASHRGPAQSYVEGVLDRAETARRDRKDRRRGMGEGGKPGDPPEDKEAAKARDKLLKQYQAIEADLSAPYKARLELATMQETLNKAMAAGIKMENGQALTMDRVNELMTRKRKLLQDQLDPYNAVIGDMEKEIIATQNLAGSWDNVAEVKKRINDLYKQGIDLTLDQVSAMERLMAVQKGLAEDQKRKQDLLGKVNYVSPQEQRSRALAEAYQFDPASFNKAADRIDSVQFMPMIETSGMRYENDVKRIIALGDEWRAMGADENAVLSMQAAILSELNKEYGKLEYNQRSLMDGFSMGWKDTMSEFGNLAQNAAALFKDSMGLVKDTIVDLVTGAKVEWLDLFETIMRGLANVATQEIIYSLAEPLMSHKDRDRGQHGGDGTIGFFADIGSAIARHSATGGVYKVSGPPGIDNVPVSFMMTPGETVSVTPAGREPVHGGGGGGNGGTNVIIVRNEAEAALTVLQSPAGRKRQVKNLSYNEALLRTLTAKA